MFSEELDLRPECDGCSYFEEGVCQKGVCIFREDNDIMLYDENEDYHHTGAVVITTSFNKESREIKQ